MSHALVHVTSAACEQLLRHLFHQVCYLVPSIRNLVSHADALQESIPIGVDVLPMTIAGGNTELLGLAMHQPALYRSGHCELLLVSLWACNVLDSTAFAALHVNSECFRYVPLHVRKLFLDTMRHIIENGASPQRSKRRTCEGYNVRSRSYITDPQPIRNLWWYPDAWMLRGTNCTYVLHVFLTFPCFVRLHCVL